MAKAYITPEGATWEQRAERWHRWYDRYDHPGKNYLRRRMLAEIDVGPEHRASVRVFYVFARKWGYEVDHIVPLCEGGLHVLWNLQLLPRRCNQAKRGRLPDCVTGQLSLVEYDPFPVQQLRLI